MFNWHNPYSRVHTWGHKRNWVLSWEAFFLVKTLQRLSIPYSESRWATQQVVYLPDKYVAVDSKYHLTGNKVLFDYFHGDPNISPSFKPLLEKLTKHRTRYSGIRVAHSGVENLLLNEGFEGKVFKIPIGIELDWFKVQTAHSRQIAREGLGIPQSAVVIGSFQKDGNGWGAGDTPKLIKGPDIFLKSIELLKNHIPELFVLLTGPARGYVKEGLTGMGVPYQHHFVDKYNEIPRFYQALDVYIVSSREEGGPKAVLESMASGVPLITTNVGQAVDFIEHGVNGWITEVEDVDALAYWAHHVVDKSRSIRKTLINARKTAVKNSYNAQTPLWKSFIEKFIKVPSN